MFEPWKTSFVAFYSYVGPRPSSEYSLDRFPNAGGNYEPGNVRWATDEEQSRNRGDYNVLVPLQGRMVTVGEWAAITGGKAHLVYERLRRGWTPADAINLPEDSTRGQRHIGMKRSPVARANMSLAQIRRHLRVE